MALRKQFHPFLSLPLCCRVKQYLLHFKLAAARPRKRVVVEKTGACDGLVVVCVHKHTCACMMWPQELTRTLMRFPAMHLAFQHSRGCSIDVMVCMCSMQG